MGEIEEARRRHHLTWRLAGGALAVMFSFIAFATFALAGCHDAGGFCSEKFSGTHVAFYAIGTLSTAVAAAAATAAFSTRTGSLRAALAAGWLVGAAVAVVLELLP